MYANPTYIIPKGLVEDVKRYNTVDEIKSEAPWAVDTVEKLINKGVLLGRGNLKDEQGRPADLDLSEDMLRLLVINDRSSLY
jgi:hypothetical protein